MELKQRAMPPWEHDHPDRALPASSHGREPGTAHRSWGHGGVSTTDNGEFAVAFAAARQDEPLTDTQIQAVIDTIVRAREAGADMTYLDPTAPAHERMLAFGAIVRPAIARGEIPGLTLCDDGTLQQLYDATLSWGAHVQRLLDDPDVTEVKIIGRAALAASARGHMVEESAYTSLAEPSSRVIALAQLTGVLWDRIHPAVTIPVPNKTRLHATRAPLLAEHDLLIVIRRGRTHPWIFRDLVARGALSEAAAALLTTLVRAQLSLIVSGPQDSGKTTFLECALNALPLQQHIVLVEDNTDEFCLRSRLVTRLQVNVSGGATAYDIVVRETLRMTPDILVPGEIRGAEAGAIAQIAEAGRPTATTIHARSPQAALRRFARLAASDIPGNSFARHPELALRVIAESFHLVVHVGSSQRLGRRIVRFVGLLNGLDRHENPDLIPLIEAVQEQVEPGDGPHAGQVVIRWNCHARIEDQTLIWDDPAIITPAAIAALLADMPAEPGIAPTIVAEQQLADLIARAREALPYPDQGQAVVDLLTQAHRLDPQHRDIWLLLERLLDSNPLVRATTATAVETAIENLIAALDGRDLSVATRIVETASENLVLQVALSQEARWKEAHTAFVALSERVAELENELAAAHAIATQQGDYARALKLLQRFTPQSLPQAQAEELLETRVVLLQAQRRQTTTHHAAVLEQQLRIAEQALEELRSQTTPQQRSTSAATEQPGKSAPTPGASGADRPVRSRVESTREEAADRPESPLPAAEDAAPARRGLSISTESAEEVGDGLFAYWAQWPLEVDDAPDRP